MISKPRHDEAYVWVWLPDATQPVVAGRLARDGDGLIFNYGRRYLELEGAIPLYLPELPLRTGAIPPEPGHADIGAIDELTYLLEHGRLPARWRTRCLGAACDPE